MGDTHWKGKTQMKLLRNIVIIFLLLAAAAAALVYFAPEPKGDGADSVTSEIKGLIGHTQDMDDRELARRIRSIAGEHGLDLVDSQVEQLAALCRGMESLSGDELAEKVDEVKDTLDTLINAGRQISRLGGYLSRAREFIGSLIDDAKELIGK